MNVPDVILGVAIAFLAVTTITLAPFRALVLIVDEVTNPLFYGRERWMHFAGLIVCILLWVASLVYVVYRMVE